MNQIRIANYMSIVILSLLVLLMAGVAYAAEEESLPFIGIIKGNAAPVPLDPPCIIENRESGDGFATHIGRITSVTSHEIAVFCPDPPDEGVVNGDMEISNASGDVLYLTYTTQAKINPDLKEISFRGPYQVTGGEGRYENASGRGTIAGQGSLDPPYEVAAILMGKLSLDDFED